MSNKEDNDAIDFFTKSIETQGVAVSSVSDGHVFGFTRKHLQAVLDANPDRETFIIFVKQPTFKN